MSKIVDYMKEVGLIDNEKIQDYFFKASIENIVSFHEYIQDLAFEDWDISEYSPYSFSPSMELCGFGGCAEYNCKLSRASIFNKFASLYSDTVYFIVDSITNPHVFVYDGNKEREFYYRYELACDYSLIWLYSDLIDKGIARIIPPNFSICPDCFAECVYNEKEIVALKPLIEQYSKKAIIEAVEYNTSTKNGCIAIRNLPELFPDHDAYINVHGKHELKVM